MPPSAAESLVRWSASLNMKDYATFLFFAFPPSFWWRNMLLLLLLLLLVFHIILALLIILIILALLIILIILALLVIVILAVVVFISAPLVTLVITYLFIAGIFAIFCIIRVVLGLSSYPAGTAEEVFAEDSIYWPCVLEFLEEYTFCLCLF
jgi:hypothetical protein